MKKTILATVIAATSFGSMADANIEPIDRGIDPVRSIEENRFNNLSKELGFDAKIETNNGTDVTISYIDANGDTQSHELVSTQGTVNDENISLVKNAFRQAALDDRIKLPGQPSDGDLAPIGDVIVPSQPSTDAKVKGFNDAMATRELDANIEKGATLNGEETYVLTMKNKTTGETVTVDLKENAQEALERSAAVKQAVRDHVEPGLPIVEPIPGEETPPLIGDSKLRKAAQELRESGSNLNESGKAAAQQAAVQQNQIDELYAIGDQNASDIDTLFGEVDRLDTRIDQTQALNAATVNARPMVTNGMTAFGAGVGYAGSEAALAIGVAHSFEDTGWSASGTVAASSDDSVLGAGVQYAF